MGTRFLEHEDLKYLQTLALFFDMDSKSFLEANRLCQNELKLRTTEELRAFPGGLNFPFALYVFATIEVFAAAHSGNQNVTAKQVGKFMSHYLGRTLMSQTISIYIK